MHSSSTQGAFSRFLTNYGFAFVFTLVVIFGGPLLYLANKADNKRNAFRESVELAALEADVRFRTPNMREIQAFRLKQGMAIAYVPLAGRNPYPIVCRLTRGRPNFFLASNPRFPHPMFDGWSDAPRNNPVTRSCHEAFGLTPPEHIFPQATTYPEGSA